MKNFFLIMFIFIYLLACRKEDENISSIHDRYIIELDANNIIHKLQYYKEGVFSFRLEFSYNEDYVRVVKYNANDSIVAINQNYLSNNLADSCVDTTFSNGSVRDITIRLNEYSQGYRIKQTSFYSNNHGVVDFKRPLHIEYAYSDGNLTDFIVVEAYCTGSNYYSELPSKLNIISFEGEYLGHQNKNLKSKYHPGGCPSGPSYVFPYTTYTYKLNSDGYVTERVSNYTPGHHSSEDKPAVEKTITEFEYVFR